MKNIRARFAAFLVGFGFVASGVVVAATFNLFQPAQGILKGNPSTYVTTAAASSDVISLWSGTCNASTFLKGDGSCAAPPPTGVTSVGLTMPSGFSVTGSPVTSTGTLGVTTTLNGLLAGNGSGFATANSGNVISLWSGTCNASTFLRADGSCQTAGGGTPGGSNTQIQFNNSGAFGGDSGLTWNASTDTLAIAGGAFNRIVNFQAQANKFLIAPDVANASHPLEITGGTSTDSGPAGVLTVSGGNVVGITANAGALHLAGGSVQSLGTGTGGALTLDGGVANGPGRAAGEVVISGGTNASDSSGAARIRLRTSNTDRFAIGSDGALLVGTGLDPGVIGNVLTSNGPGFAPTWSPPGGSAKFASARVSSTGMLEPGSVNISSTFKNTTGNYSVSFSSGFSNAPACTVGNENVAVYILNFELSINSLGVTVGVFDDTAAFDSPFSIICIGT